MLGTELSQILYLNSIVIALEQDPIFKVLGKKIATKIAKKTVVHEYSKNEVVIDTSVKSGSGIWITVKGWLKQGYSKFSDTLQIVGADRIIGEQTAT
jgi:hypothetical protein